VDYSKLEDDALLGQIVMAQQHALSEIYDRYSSLVYSIAFHIIGDQAMAEEITLDVFTKVWQKANTYRAERGSVYVWLTSITRNRSIDRLRQEISHQNAQRGLWADITAQTDLREEGPETAVALSLRKRQIQTAISKLTEDQRDVVALAYFKGYTQREIAELRDLPLGTVKTRIRSAIQKLRQLLQDEQLD
jgi:RNA polymerase sigma-70 factor (ECF subfamily)